MRFNEYVEERKVGQNIAECASILAQLDVDPEAYVLRFAEANGLSEGLGDWLSGVGKAAARWGTGAVQAGRSLWSGGLEHGIKSAKDTIAGPKVKFEKALATLKDLADFLNKNDETKGMQSHAQQGLTVGNYIEKIRQELEKEKTAIPQMSDASVSQSYKQGAGGETQNAQTSNPAQPQSGAGQQVVSAATGPSGSMGNGGAVAPQKGLDPGATQAYASARPTASQFKARRDNMKRA